MSSGITASSSCPRLENILESKAFKMHACSLVFFHFVRGTTKFRYNRTNGPIGKVLEKLPQHAFGGDLSGLVFGGKNVISEGNNLIIIKGDNSPEAWSRTEAIRDAQEEVAAIRESR